MNAGEKGEGRKRKRGRQEWTCKCWRETEGWRHRPEQRKRVHELAWDHDKGLKDKEGAKSWRGTLTKKEDFNVSRLAIVVGVENLVLRGKY